MGERSDRFFLLFGKLIPHRQSLKAQVQTNLRFLEDAKSKLLQSSEPQQTDEEISLLINAGATEVPSGVMVKQPTLPGSASSQSVVPYEEEEIVTGDSESDATLCLDNSEDDLSLASLSGDLGGILSVQEMTLELAEGLLKFRPQSTWSWTSPEAMKTAGHEIRIIDQSRLDHVTAGRENATAEKQHSRNKASNSNKHFKNGAANMAADPMQHLDNEKLNESVKAAAMHTALEEEDLLRRVVEERHLRTQPGSLPQGTRAKSPVNSQYRDKEEIESPFAVGDGTERLTKLERFMLAERDKAIRQEAIVEAESIKDLEKSQVEATLKWQTVERENAKNMKFSRLEDLLLEQDKARVKKEVAKAQAAAEAAERKRKEDVDKLAKLERLILASREEQLKREAERAAEIADEQAIVAKEIAERHAASERAEEILEAAKRSRDEAERKAAAESEELKAKSERKAAETKAAYEKAVAEAKAATEELKKARQIAPEEFSVKFKDAIGRRFTFPWKTCKAWKGMEELIHHAYSNANHLVVGVTEGQYDLLDKNGEILLPKAWEELVHPVSEISMRMWDSTKQELGKREASAKGIKLRGSLGKIFDRK